jgi:hypothetical protein
MPLLPIKGTLRNSDYKFGSVSVFNLVHNLFGIIFLIIWIKRSLFNLDVRYSIATYKLFSFLGWV